MSSITLAQLHTLNSARWAKAKLTRRPEYVSGSYAPIPRILAARNRYELIQAQTGVHWVFVASSHYREANLNFSCQLAQGDPLNRVSKNYPYTGPFKTFEEGTYDALVRQAPYAARNKNWSMPFLLTLEEAYNGLGYARMGIPSPYVWSGTTEYTKGKYIRDRVFDPNTVDKQLGVAGLVMCLLEADPTIKFGDSVKPSEKPVETITPPAATKVAPTSVNAPATPVEAPKPMTNADHPSNGVAKEPSVPPIINKDGEDITALMEDYLHNVWEWLRKH